MVKKISQRKISAKVIQLMFVIFVAEETLLHFEFEKISLNESHNLLSKLFHDLLDIKMNCG